jgi:hypothetical protein
MVVIMGDSITANWDLPWGINFAVSDQFRRRQSRPPINSRKAVEKASIYGPLNVLRRLGSCVYRFGWGSDSSICGHFGHSQRTLVAFRAGGWSSAGSCGIFRSPSQPGFSSSRFDNAGILSFRLPLAKETSTPVGMNVANVEQINLSGQILDLFPNPDRMVLISLQAAPDRWQRVSPTDGDNMIFKKLEGGLFR